MNWRGVVSVRPLSAYAPIGMKHDSPTPRRPQPSGSSDRKRRVDAGGDLPRWIREEIQLTTPKDRREAAIEALSRGAAHYAADRYSKAVNDLRRAKDLTSSAATVRELLGLALYQTESWTEALRELRAYRRLAGDTTHMPVELDCLRALGRSEDVHKTWRLFLDLGGAPLTDAEARVVYGSFLLDQHQPREAWDVTRPNRITKDPRPYELRLWFVAARAAAEIGDKETARQLRDGIRASQPDFDGLDQLDSEVA